MPNKAGVKEITLYKKYILIENKKENIKEKTLDFKIFKKRR